MAGNKTLKELREELVSLQSEETEIHQRYAEAVENIEKRISDVKAGISLLLEAAKDPEEAAIEREYARQRRRETQLLEKRYGGTPADIRDYWNF